MIVSMQTTAVAGEAVAAINRFSYHTTARTRSLTANIDDVGIVGIDSDWHVIEALSRAETLTTRKLRRPTRAAVDRLSYSSRSGITRCAGAG